MHFQCPCTAELQSAEQAQQESEQQGRDKRTWARRFGITAMCLLVRFWRWRCSVLRSQRDEARQLAADTEVKRVEQEAGCLKAEASLAAAKKQHARALETAEQRRQTLAEQLEQLQAQQQPTEPPSSAADGTAAAALTKLEAEHHALVDGIVALAMEMLRAVQEATKAEDLPVIDRSSSERLVQSLRAIWELGRALFAERIPELAAENRRLTEGLARAQTQVRQGEETAQQLAKLQTELEQVNARSEQLGKELAQAQKAAADSSPLPRLRKDFSAAAADPPQLAALLAKLGEEEVGPELASCLLAWHARSQPREGLAPWIEQVFTTMDSSTFLEQVIARSICFPGGVQLFLSLSTERREAVQPLLGLEAIIPLCAYVSDALGNEQADIIAIGRELLAFAGPRSGPERLDIASWTLILLQEAAAVKEAEGSSSGARLHSAFIAALDKQREAEQEHPDTAALDALAQRMHDAAAKAVQLDPTFYFTLAQTLRYGVAQVLVDLTMDETDSRTLHSLIGYYLAMPSQFRELESDAQLLYIAGQVLPAQAVALLCMLLEPADAALVLFGPGENASEEAYLYIQPDVLRRILAACYAEEAAFVVESPSKAMARWKATKAQLVRHPSRSCFWGLAPFALQNTPELPAEPEETELAEQTMLRPPTDEERCVIRHGVVVGAKDVFARHREGLSREDLTNPTHGILTLMRRACEDTARAANF